MGLLPGRSTVAVSSLTGTSVGRTLRDDTSLFARCHIQAVVTRCDDEDSRDAMASFARSNSLTELGFTRFVML